MFAIINDTTMNSKVPKIILNLLCRYLLALFKLEYKFSHLRCLFFLQLPHRISPYISKRTYYWSLYLAGKKAGTPLTARDTAKYWVLLLRDKRASVTPGSFIQEISFYLSRLSWVTKLFYCIKHSLHI